MDMQAWHVALTIQFSEGFFKRLSLQIRHVASSFVQRSDLDDACQDVLLRLFEHRDSFHLGGEKEYFNWARRVTFNLMVSQYRRRRLSLRIRGDIHALAESYEMANRNTQIDLIDKAASVKRIQHHLEKLSPQWNKMLLLYAEGMQYQQIAETVGCPIGTVMSTLHRARKRICEAFQAESALFP